MTGDSLLEYRLFVFDDMVRKIRDREPFAFSRFGDGEFACMTGVNGANCDGHGYYPELGKRLKAVLQDNPSYYVGVQPKLMKDSGPDFVNWLRVNGIYRAWVNADILHDASIAGRFIKEFVYELSECDTCFVVPASYSGFELPFCDAVYVPEKNCWLAYEHVKSQVLDMIADGDSTFCFSAGMMSKVMIHELWQMFPDRTYIDLGSVLDPYLGLNTRRYHGQIIERGEKLCE